jgi:hypothetical protein
MDVSSSRLLAAPSWKHGRRRPILPRLSGAALLSISGEALLVCVCFIGRERVWTMELVRPGGVP